MSVLDFILSPIEYLVWALSPNGFGRIEDFLTFNISLWMTILLVRKSWISNSFLIILISINWKLLMISSKCQLTALAYNSCSSLSLTADEGWLSYLSLLYFVIIIYFSRIYIQRVSYVQKLMKLKESNVFLSVSTYLIIALSAGYLGFYLWVGVVLLPRLNDHPFSI